MKTNIILIISLIITAVLSTGCSRTTSPDASESDYSYEKWATTFQRYCRKGLYDSLEADSRMLFASRHKYDDELLAALAGLNVAQAAIFQENYKTANAFLDSIEAMGYEDLPVEFKAMYFGIRAIGEMKGDFDYPSAIKHLTSAIRFYKEEGNMLNTCTGLCNISMIHYFKKDTNGTQYARQALEISKKHPEDPFLKCISEVTLSVMYLLKQEYGKAESLALDALKLAKENDYSLVYSRIYMVLGSILQNKGDNVMAETLFKKGFEYSSNSDPDFYYELAVPYSELLLDENRYREALDFLESTLTKANSYKNLRYRYQILQLLSKAHEMNGDTTMSYRYYKMFHAASDSLFNIDKETSFNNLMNLYEKASLENDIKKKQMHVYIAASVALIIILAGISLLYIYKRQKKSYRQLVKRHQEFMHRYEIVRRQLQESMKKDSEEKSDDERLYEKLEALMSEQKAYRQNDISLDKVASTLNSNRTYVSRIINRYSGKTFYSYINMYRIEDAIQMLTNTDMALKEICNIIGYNSLTAFYRVFLKEIGCPPSKYREEVRKMKGRSGQ